MTVSVNKHYIEVNERRLYATKAGKQKWMMPRDGRGFFYDDEVDEIKAWVKSKKYRITSHVVINSTPHVYGKEAKVNVKLLVALENVAREHGAIIQIVSGYRTRAEQLKLYKAYIEGKGNPANKPGSSQHEKGEAVDAYVNGVSFWLWADNKGIRSHVIQKHKLCQPHAGEAWHVERVR